MDTHNSERRLHPLMMAAAISIIVFCGVGVAAISGLLPMVKGQESPAASEVAIANTSADSSPAKAAEAMPAAALETATPVSTPKHHVASVAKAPSCHSCGTVVAVNAVKVQGTASGVGAVGGAVAGGVVGHQFGKGHGKDAMTVLGAVGGALAGNQVEKTVRTSTRYDVVVRMQDGSTQTISDTTPPPFASGDKVRVENGTLAHAN
ncbi:MAG: glycine zipper 2TM domain-containing protein [Moraxellaceae bacterium]